jgi:hypothetical protein
LRNLIEEEKEMDYAAILDVFTRYGAIAIFVLVFLEYMNLPGFPAGIIMPLAGIMAAGGGTKAAQCRLCPRSAQSHHCLEGERQITAPGRLQSAGP